MSEPALPVPGRTILRPLALGAGLAVLGVAALLVLFGALGYGWDEPQERAIPVLVLFFVAGIAGSQLRNSLVLRSLILILATALAVPAWWLTPQKHFSLQDAARLRDELSADLASPTTIDKAFMVDKLKDKRDELRRASPSLAHQIDSKLDDWADEVGEAIDEQFRKASAEDTETAVQADKAYWALSHAFTGSTSYSARQDWIDRAVTSKKRELAELPFANWAGFDRTATERHFLADNFLRSREPLISAEEEWVNKGMPAILLDIRSQTKAKSIREACYESEKQLLALKSLDISPARFREARATLFNIALDTVQKEVREYSQAKRYDVAYGIARKFAVDWYKTARLLGPQKQKLLEELRDRFSELAATTENAGELPELAPIPRTSETTPAARVKP